MNKYTAQGLALAAAIEGRRILVVAYNQAETRAALGLIMTAVTDGQRVSRLNGRERVTYPSGGRISFTTPNSRGHRGLAVDTVFLDADVDREYPHLIGELAPCVNASPTGEVVRA